MLSANITNAQRKAIYRRDGFRCALCDSPKYLQIHHYIPRGKGGHNHPHNLITLCSQCHSVAHGEDIYFSYGPEDLDFQMVEYLSDYYANLGEAWDPYLKDKDTPERLDHEPDATWWRWRR